MNDDAPLRQPDIFERSTFLVDEMVASGQTLLEKLSALRIAMTHSYTRDSHDRTLEVASIVAQLASLNSSLATQLVTHMVQEKIDGRAGR